MSRKTKINGTEYTISGGKTKINGTEYTISAGKTKVGGTVKTISLSKPLPDVLYLYNNGDPCTDITGGWINCQTTKTYHDAIRTVNDLSSIIQQYSYINAELVNCNGTTDYGYSIDGFFTNATGSYGGPGLISPSIFWNGEDPSSRATQQGMIRVPAQSDRIILSYPINNPSNYKYVAVGVSRNDGGVYASGNQYHIQQSVSTYLESYREGYTNKDKYARANICNIFLIYLTK